MRTVSIVHWSHDVLTWPSQRYGWMLCIMTKHVSDFL